MSALRPVSLVALLTDFGESEYVGQMKGVLAGLWPGGPVVDLCHTITPHDVREGAWVLWTSYRHFPAGTLFVAVVDPGVGTDRPAVAVESRRYRWVGPDNGLLYPTVQEDGFVRAVELPVPPQASPTFHGRDLFAPAAGRWAAGEDLEALGNPRGGLSVPLAFPQEEGRGEVVRVDRFGNLVTTLPVPTLPCPGGWLGLRLEPPGGGPGVRVRMRLLRTYGEGDAGELVAVVGSSSTLEVSVVGGSALHRLGAGAGWRVTVEQAPAASGPSDGGGEGDGGPGGRGDGRRPR